MGEENEMEEGEGQEEESGRGKAQEEEQRRGGSSVQWFEKFCISSA